MHYEHHNQPLLPRRAYLLRLLGHSLLAITIILIALFIGVAGYHYIGGLSWIDSLLNASMILGGMGPVDPLSTVPAKLFASFYALFAGVAFLAIAGVLLAPVAHRFLHRLHLEVEDDGADEGMPS
jgi:flagellar biosynthesis protein FliR